MNASDQKRSIRRAVAALVLAAGLTAVQAATPVRSGQPVRSPKASALLGVVVTDRLPIVNDRNQATFDPLSVGPFTGHETTDLNILAIYDRRLLGTAPFDQVVTLTLPDGHRYSRKVIPVDPAAATAVSAHRPDLSVAPVRVQSAPRMKRLARLLPEGRITEAQMREAVYTKDLLPVAGTWITSHNLYGEWIVTIELVRDNAVVASTSSAFRIEAE